MAKPPKRKERGAINGAFAWRLIEMLESPANRALSLSAKRIFERLEIELYRHGGKPEENGKLPCTYEHFIEFGLHRHAIPPALRELTALGFVEITQQGCAGNAGYRQPTLYRLTYRHFGSHRETTDEWRSIKTVEEAEITAARARSPLPMRAPKTKLQCRKPSPAPVPETITEKGDSPVPETITTVPVPETITTSISLREGLPFRERHDSAAVTVPAQPHAALHANVAKLPWSPPRWVEITPEIDGALNRVLDGRSRPGLPAPVDALTELEGLILSNTVPDGSAVREAVH